MLNREIQILKSQIVDLQNKPQSEPTKDSKSN